MVLAHPPGVEHADFGDSAYSLFFIYIDAPHGIPWPHVCSDDSDQSIGKTCEAIWREWGRASLGREQMLALLASQLDLLLRRARVSQQRSPEEELVAAAARILEERYRDAPTVDELAREVGVSRSSLYAHFIGVKHQTPPEYVLAVRLRHALGLLQHSRLKLETIAQQCGFYSSSHLSRHVKAATGKTPGALRLIGDVGGVDCGAGAIGSWRPWIFSGYQGHTASVCGSTDGKDTDLRESGNMHHD
jgi:AraC-like DNA-binding protein